MAVCLGATSVERHITLDRTMWGTDHAASLEENGMSQEEALAWMIEQSTSPQKVVKFTFGKYRGERVDEVAKKDIKYLQWLFGEKKKQIAAGEISEEDEWVYTLKDYCN